MKAEITVIEFDYHPEVLRDLCQIMADTPFKVNIFTRENIWKLVGLQEKNIPTNIHVFIQPANASISKFIKSNIETLNNSKLIIFNTLASNYKLFSKLKIQPKTIIRIHNTNAYFGNFPNSYKPKFSLFYIWKDFSHIIRKNIGELDWYYRRKIIKKSDFYAFPNKVTANYARDHFKIPESKLITLPLSFTPEAPSHKKNSEPRSTTIAIIGKVDQRNRDYLLIYHAIKSVLKKSNSKINLILLGPSNSIYGKKLIRLFKALQNPYFNLIYFKTYVDQDTFKYHIDQSDFLIIPVKINTRFTIYNEIYSLTKISGSINDILKYRKPALISAGYRIEEGLKPIVEPFENFEDLSNKIVLWSEHEKYTALPIEEVLGSYKLSAVKSQYITAINKILTRK